MFLKSIENELIMTDSMMHNNDISQLGKNMKLWKKTWLSDSKFNKYKQKPKADLNSRSAVQKPNTLTTTLRWYSNKAFIGKWCGEVYYYWKKQKNMQL